MSLSVDYKRFLGNSLGDIVRSLGIPTHLAGVVAGAEGRDVRGEGLVYGSVQIDGGVMVGDYACDKGRLTEEGRAMVEAWLLDWPAPEMLLFRWRRGLLNAARARLGEDDLRGVAFLAVVKAAAAWIPAEGEFTPLARRCIHRQILQAMRVRKTLDCDWVDGVEDARSSGDPFRAADDRDEVAVVLGRLNVRHREVVGSRFGLDGGPARTRGEVGKKFGLTGERVRQIECKSFEELAAHYEGGAA